MKALKGIVDRLSANLGNGNLLFVINPGVPACISDIEIGLVRFSVFQFGQ